MDAKVTLRKPRADTPKRYITKYTRELNRSADSSIVIGLPFYDSKKFIIFIDNMYASSHFTEIELVTWENSTSNEQKWAPTVQYFTKLYSDRLAFQNRDAGEKLLKRGLN